MKTSTARLALGLCVTGLISALPGAQAANLALNPGTTASANSVYATAYDASKAIDGDPETNWSAAGWANAMNPFWLIVDLGAVNQVSSIVLKSRDLAQYGAGYYIDYELLVSSDQSAWTALQTGRLTDAADDAWWDEAAVNGSMRYAQFKVTGGTHWAHLYEMEINGDSSTAVPEPSTLLLLPLAGLALQRRRARRAT